MIYTNGFSEEENNLLSDWLKERWGVESKVIFTKSSTTGNISPQLYLPPEGYLALIELITPYVPECMMYKAELATKTCPMCGKEFPFMGNSPCCSQECSERMIKEHKAEYSKQYAQEHAAERQAWKDAHREQINAAARERYANITEEQREALNAYCRKWRAENREAHLATRRAWRASKKGDPEY
jgi:hypothetical protein